MMRRAIGPAALLLALSFPGGAAEAPDAGPIESVYRNARVYTMDPARPWAEAFAVDGGRLLAVGSEAELAPLARRAGKVVDLDGRLVLPGFIDAHVHAVMAGVNALYACNFAFSATPEVVRQTIAACVEEQPDAQWIKGGQWTSDFFVVNDIGVPREFLDAVSGDKAVILTDDSGHNHWANTRALALLGIDRDSPDPPGGKYWRDADGVPTGVLMEAFEQVNAAVPPYDDGQHRDGARYARDQAHRFGIVGLKDASASEPELAAYTALDRSGELDLYVAASLYRSEHEWDADGVDLPALAAMRDRYATPRVGTRFVKIFLDGVPTSSRTAAMLEPYVPDAEHGAGFRGSLHLEPETLTDSLLALDAAGYTVKIHTAGDRAVRVALDAIERVRGINGRSGLRHELAHAGYVAEADIPRFAALNAVADFSPYIWTPSPIIDSVVGAVGERGERYWPTRDLLDAGAAILVGSDWPSAVPSMNPWVGLEGLLTRRDPAGEHPGELWPEQAISLEEALPLFTIAGARALRIDGSTGSLEAGKSADFLVLDRDLFSIPTAEIGDTQVLATYFQGRRVYEAGAGDPAAGRAGGGTPAAEESAADSAP